MPNPSSSAGKGFRLVPLTAVDALVLNSLAWPEREFS
jgi:hypothetical protein